MTASRDVTAELAAFAAGLRLEDVPPAVRKQATTILVDAIGSAFAGYDAEEVGAVARFAHGLGDSGESTVIGGDRLSFAGATLLNGYLVTAVTMCDMHRPTTCHVSPSVVAPALVQAEATRASGSATLAAVVAGLEVTTRVGLGLHPAELRAREWHAPGVIGPFGGAAAAGRILGLGPDQMASAFGLAASQAAGTYAHLGTPTMKFQQARAALSGTMAAGLAAQGFTAATDVLTKATGGLFGTYSDGGDPDAVVDGLGTDWELTRISLRPWPVAMHLQPVVTAVMQLLAEGAPPLDTIGRVRLEVSPLAYDMHAAVPWTERFRARLSAPYVLAVALADGRCGIDQFSATRIADPALAAFIRAHVAIETGPQRANGTARLVLETVDGGTRVMEVTAAKGEPANPMTRDEVIAKFLAGAAPRIGASRAHVAIEGLLDLEDVDDMTTVTASLGRS